MVQIWPISMWRRSQPRLAWQADMRAWAQFPALVQRAGCSAGCDAAHLWFPKLRRQRQLDLCELYSLAYRVSFRTARVLQKDPILKKKVGGRDSLAQPQGNWDSSKQQGGSTQGRALPSTHFCAYISTHSYQNYKKNNIIQPTVNVHPASQVWSGLTSL